jgi:hypothetical protein
MGKKGITAFFFLPVRRIIVRLFPIRGYMPTNEVPEAAASSKRRQRKMAGTAALQTNLLIFDFGLRNFPLRKHKNIWRE